MALQYLFDPNKQFQSTGGVNEVGGFLRVFFNGTDDRATTYRNFDGGLNEPDIVLDTNGRAVVIVDDSKTFRLEVYNRFGGLMWTVSNYKARGGSGGGSTPVKVEGTAGEIEVFENEVGGVKHFVVGLAATIKNAISSLTSAVNGLALSLGNKKERQTPKEFLGSTTKTVVGVSQNEDGEMSVLFEDIPLDNYELNENKKTTVTGYEGSNTYFPTIKAVVDFVNGMMQNLGGKLITDNGDPFASSSALPTTTPYQGVDIADKDYAYIQGVGTAERWSATVSGSSVAWVQEYAISIPVFTPTQQAAIDSGVTAAMLGTFLTKTGDGSNVTAAFTAAGSRTNISTGEKLSAIFGKIAKWFSDLKALAFKDKVSDSDISGTIADAHIASANSWNEKQNALPTTGTPSSTFAINVSGTSRYSENVLPYYVSTDNDKSWLEVGTYKSNNSDEMFSGIMFAVKFRSVDGHTQSGFVWISVGEWKSGGDYSNDDIVCEYYTLGRRVKEQSDSVKLYVNILGTYVTDGVKIYAYLAGYSNISLTPLNVNKGTYTSSMNYLNAEPATKKEVTYCNLLRSTYGTAIGGATSPVYVDQYGRVNECDPMAKKASSGNGTLAVIDANGNYASSGIGAYAQSQLNSAITNSIIPWLTNNSYIVTHSFWIQTNASVVGRSVEFVNSYTGENLLRISVSYDYVNGEISFILPWSNASWNGWIIANPDPQSTAEVGGAIITANGTKHTSNSSSDTVTPFYTHTEETIHSNNVSQTTIGTFNVGKSTTYDTSSYYDFVITLFNGLSSKRVTLKISMAIDRYVSGSGTTANIIGMATIDASGLNI